MAEEPARRVLVLPDSLINKIAAGEVVERPASVVKELVENAVDAGATRVTISVRGGGRGLIRVRDDGEGMTREDALTALQRHATSKVRTDDDLFAIGTFGFRGEALPSIAEVSRFELRTGVPGAVTGTRVVVDGGVIDTIEDAANPGGTEIAVHRLFVTTPARLKFLKSDRTEVGHITEWTTRVAIAHPEIAFRLDVDDRTVFDVPAVDGLLPRVRALLGKSVSDDLRPFSAAQDGDGLTVEGLVSLPTLTRSSAAGLYLFVNGRYVKDRAMTGAVLQAWRELLPRGRYPVAVLFLDLPPERVDVNVHPQKLEVRFRSGSAVWRFLSGALSRRLRELGGVLATPGEQQTSFLPPQARGGLRPSAPSRPTLGTPSRPVRPWSAEEAAAVLDRAVAPRRPAETAPSPTPPTRPAASGPPVRDAGERILGRMGDRLLVRDGEDLLVLDLPAARRLLLFDRLRSGVALTPKRLLVPGLLDLAAADVRALEAEAERLLPLGLEVAAFGADTLALHALAPEYDASAAGALLEDVRAALRDGPRTADALDRELARVLSAFPAPLGDRPPRGELEALVDAVLGRGSAPPDLPRPVVRLRGAQLDGWFRRGGP